MGCTQYGVSLEKGETKEVGNQKESVRSGTGPKPQWCVMAGWEVKHCFLLQLPGPFWAFSAPLLVTETANQNTQNGNVTCAMKTARKGESSGGREGGFAMILW